MRSTSFLSFCFFLFTISTSGQEAERLKYMGLKPPTMSPVVFAPGLISLDSQYEFGSVFNKEVTEFFYGVETGNGSVIRYSKLQDGRWSAPATVLSASQYGMNDPFLSPDENRLYFISTKALEGPGAKQDHDIWYVERQGDRWSKPINAGPNINTNSNEYYISFTADGSMYFSSNKPVKGQKDQNFDIYYSQYKGNEFQAAVRLGAAINTSNYEADVFIDPAEQYIIFCANRPDGLGRGDLYISFKNEDGSWSPSINMGDVINTKGHELCPFVTADGKYFFYTSNQDIYWISAGIIDKIRKGQ